MFRTLAGAGTAFAGLLTVASALSPDVPWRERLLDFEPGLAHGVAHAIAACGGVALAGLSVGVGTGRRRASQVVVVLLWLLAAVHVAKGLDYEEALLGAGLALAVAAGVRASARGGVPSPRLLAGLAALVAVIGAYAASVTALMVAGHSPGVGDALLTGARVAADGGRALAGDAAGLIHVLVAVALVAAGLWVRALLAPTPAVGGHDASEHARAADLVARYGDDSLAPFVLRADKAFFFAAGGVLAYRTLRETAVVSGDPVGPPGSPPGIVDAFVRFAAARGWDVVLTGASEAHLEGYRRLGLRWMQVGAEAIADPQEFSLEGRSVRKVRQSVHRIQRRGWSIQIVGARDLTAALVGELHEVEREWRGGRARVYGFAMCSDRLWGAPEDASDVYAVGRDPDGRARAFLRFVPYRRGLSLDAMRRLEDAPNGLNEALVVAALEHARVLGLREVSLNFAGFAHVMAAEALTARQRVLRWLLRRSHRRFQLERLVHFNDKFTPAWRPRYLVYTGHTRLALAALRVLQAEAYVKAPRPVASATAWRPRPEPLQVATPEGAR